jgi:hypothetical protein
MTLRHLRNVKGFFSDYYLGSIFGRGDGRGRRKRLSDRDTDLAYRRFIRIHTQTEIPPDDAPACREKFIRPFLRDVLGFHLSPGEDRVHLLFESAEAADAHPLLAVYCGVWAEELDAGSRAALKSIERLLGDRDLDYGILLTGERLRLIRAPGEGPRGAYLEVDLASLAEEEDPESFAAAFRLLHSSNWIPGPDGEPAIRKVEAESRKHAEAVTEDLKRAVFASAESLIDGLIEDGVERGRTPDRRSIRESDLLRLRDASLTALYRILFVLYAEARDPRLDEHPIYFKSYSMHGLIDELLRNQPRFQAENRTNLWNRLRALFRVYGETGLPQIGQWEHLPPRGGDLFKSTTLEGRVLDEAALPDAVVSRVLLDLATTLPRAGVGRERVSFRELDIESLGAVYEGLLEFEPRVARETTIEIRVQGRTYALPPGDVVRLCRERQLALSGDIAIVEGTEAGALHPDAVTEDEGEEEEEEEEGYAGDEAEESDEGDEVQGVKKGARARLTRRLEPGAFYFVPGAARKGSGSFYTRRPLVADLVRRALGPLVDGRKAREIECLRIVDPACGSAHFLVEAMRYLGKELHRAYVEEHKGKPPPHFRHTVNQGWDADWKASDEDARASNSEARAWCKRRIAERCLFGVDLNPTAVGLAQVALWIESLAGDRPLSYFKHHIRCGNSLLGTWMDRLHDPPLPQLGKGIGGGGLNLFAAHVRGKIEEAAAARRLIDRAASEGAVEPDSLGEQEFREHEHRRALTIVAGARLLFDLRSASAFVPPIWNDWATLCTLLGNPTELERFARSRPWWEPFEQVCARERFFHWELEFPEVFLDARPGFDAVLGNPPWDKVLPNKKEFFGRHDVLIRAYSGADFARRVREICQSRPTLPSEYESHRERILVIARMLRERSDFPNGEAKSQSANEDVSKYFVDRAIRILREGAAAGLVVPSVLYNGDGCVGIRTFLLQKSTIERFYGFENRAKIFPIDSRYKFVDLVFRKGNAADSFDAAFMRHDLGELEDDGPKPWMVRIPRDEIERLSPETFAFLEYLEPRDQEIVRRMYEGRPTLGGSEPGTWKVKLFSWRAHEVIFKVPDDSDLWSNPENGRLYTPKDVLGCEPKDFSETLRQMAERGFWPVFEGKHIDQFLVGTKPVRWWLSVKQAEAKYGKPPRSEPTLVFRETASNTNERTCIAAILPARVVGSHKLTGAKVDHVKLDAAAMVLNSFCFDYALRMRTAGTSVSFTYMHPMPVPPASVVDRLPVIRTRSAWESAIEHITDEKKIWPDLWEANRAVAEAYDLGPDDFRHILTRFPGVAKKRPEFYQFLLSQVDAWEGSSRRAKQPAQ